MPSTYLVPSLLYLQPRYKVCCPKLSEIICHIVHSLTILQIETCGLVWDFLNLNSVFSGNISILIISCSGKDIEYIVIFGGFLNVISILSGNIIISRVPYLGIDIKCIAVFGIISA